MLPEESSDSKFYGIYFLSAHNSMERLMSMLKSTSEIQQVISVPVNHHS